MAHCPACGKTEPECRCRADRRQKPLWGRFDPANPENEGRRIDESGRSPGPRCDGTSESSEPSRDADGTDGDVRTSPERQTPTARELARRSDLDTSKDAAARAAEPTKLREWHLRVLRTLARTDAGLTDRDLVERFGSGTARRRRSDLYRLFDPPLVELNGRRDGRAVWRLSPAGWAVLGGKLEPVRSGSG